MIVVHAINQHERYEKGEGLEDALKFIADDPKRIWIDLENEDRPAFKDIAQTFGFAADTVEDCYTGEQRPRLDEYDPYLFFVLYGALGIEEPVQFSPRKIGLYLGPNYIVTVHAEPSRTLRTARQRVEKSPQILKRGLDFLFYTILDGLVDNYLVLMDALEAQLDKLEDRSMDPEVDSSILDDLNGVRRILIELRQMIAAKREVVNEIVYGENEVIAEPLRLKMEHVRDHLNRAFEMVDGLREIIHGIRDNYFALLSERTNAFMRTLTLFATFLMPLSLISGIYGMNIILLPPTDHPLTTIFVAALMIAVTAAMYVYFRRRKWL